MNIIGISAFYHDAACCLFIDGKLVAAVSEERYTRIKYDNRLPVESFKFCLRRGKLNISDIDAIAYYENPRKKQDRQFQLQKELLDLDSPQYPSDEFVEFVIRDQLGYDGPVMFFDHHRSHAANAFYSSKFKDAAILIADGVGEWNTTTLWQADASGTILLKEINFPHSIGLLYSTITAFLGFHVNGGESKVMGLAAFGKPLFVDKLKILLVDSGNDSFELDTSYFNFLKGKRMFSEKLIQLLDHPPRTQTSTIDTFYKDLAASIQVLLEEILMEKVSYLFQITDSDNLCLAGGIALNCVANAHLARKSPFEKLYIPSAPGDAGSCIGAAILAHMKLSDKKVHLPVLPFLGPDYYPCQIKDFLSSSSVTFRDYSSEPSVLLDQTVDLLASGNIIGWFQGRMEFGPRALGNRSILAHPGIPGIKARLNADIKNREEFRPFGPSVLSGFVHEYFEVTQFSPLMNMTYSVINKKMISEVIHVDNTARVQTISEINKRYFQLLQCFYNKTGCPVVLNTSFNINREPIVCNPIDALVGMIRGGLDALIMEDILILKEDIPSFLPEILEAHWPKINSDISIPANNFASGLYSFV